MLRLHRLHQLAFRRPPYLVSPRPVTALRRPFPVACRLHSTSMTSPVASTSHPALDAPHKDQAPKKSKDKKKEAASTYPLEVRAYPD